MYSFAKVFPVIVCGILALAGCAPPQYEISLIHPYREGRPFEECSIDLGFYKPVQQRPGQDPNIVLVVAASGGGYRAANFAAGALLGLEEIQSRYLPAGNVLSEVDYFSSVSGGGFAVGAYFSTLLDYRRFNGTTKGYSFAAAIAPTTSACPCKHSPPPQQKSDPCVRRHLQGLYSDFIGDFLRTLLPWNHLGFDDRNLRFEKAIDDDTLSYRWRRKKLESLQDPNADKNAALTLADVFVRADDPGRQVVMPYWFANAAVYQNAVIFPFSPEHLRLYEATGYYHRGRKKICEHNCPDLNDFALNTPLSLAVASSANFPIAMPPLRFASKMDANNRYFYLFDGGIADNLGVITAFRLLEDKINENALARVLIVIDSYQGGLIPFTEEKKAPSEARTAVRIMETGLDSWRTRYREVINRLCEQKNIKPIYISFDDLVDADFNDLCPFGLNEQDKNDLLAHKPRGCPKATPFYIARSISMTSPVFWGPKGLEYRIPDSQQNLLIAAGRYVVSKKQGEILAALGWN
ncbi:MAG: patatin-like phospholipase family protein [Sedimentisphaerales bacterium]|nr:patatin-like phospholipase family protein [Sedimentisphaerales bacterium]